MSVSWALKVQGLVGIEGTGRVALGELSARQLIKGTGSLALGEPNARQLDIEVRRGLPVVSSTSRSWTLKVQGDLPW